MARRAAADVNLLVENEVLCEVYPYKQNSCNEMDAVRLQAGARELQDYIDAQNGGPGKGWFRIVTDPFEARRVDQRRQARGRPGHRGLRAVRLRRPGRQPECTAAQIDQRLDEVYELGVRDMEIINKFDNALGGVAGDNGTTGAVVNTATGSRPASTGRCGPARGIRRASRQGSADPGRPAPRPDRRQQDPGPAAPRRGARLRPAPHCNARGLTALGEHS